MTTVLRFVGLVRLGGVLACVAVGCGGTVAAQPGAAGDGGEAGADGGVADATADVVDDEPAEVREDAWPDGEPVCDQGVCPSPASVAGFMPTWKPPTGAHQNACTTALLQEYYADCLQPSGQDDCSAFIVDAAHVACAACLNSDFTDPVWGPLVTGEGEIETNTSGCIALTDPGALSCAMAIQASDECIHAACDPVCQGGDATGFDSWVTCSGAANSCGCASYFAATDCVKALAGAMSPAAPCLVGQTFEDYFYSVSTVFCGP